MILDGSLGNNIWLFHDSFLMLLTLSCRRSLSYRNRSTDLLLCKSIDWVLYDRDLQHERVNSVRPVNQVQLSDKFPGLGINSQILIVMMTIWYRKTVSYLISSRSSHQRCSVRKGVFRNFAKFAGKHLCQRLFFNKTSDLKTAFKKFEVILSP